MSNESGHWYDMEGRARHTQPTKKGAKNPTRPTTIRDAKEQGLFPSVSGVTGVLSQPWLTRWMKQETARACFRNPPHPGEQEDEYVASMLDKSTESTEGAADLGTAIHAAIESYFTEPLLWKSGTLIELPSGAQVEQGLFVLPAVQKMKELGLAVIHSERVLVNAPYGYAGTTDIIWGGADTWGILDYKSTKTTPGKPKEPSELHPLQIAAYHAAHYGTAFEPDNVKGYNLYISTTEIGRVEIVEYSAETLRKSWEIFQHCLALWRWRNGYDPRSGAQGA